MTALEVFEDILVELNKVNSPTFTVDQFNYFMNKTLRAFTNEKYSLYSISQQLSDDLRVLLSSYSAVVSGTDILIPSGNTVIVFTEDAAPLNTYNVAKVSDISLFRVGDTVRFNFDDAAGALVNRLITEVTIGASTFKFYPGMYSEGVPPPAADPYVTYVDVNFNIDTSLSNDKIFTFTIYVNDYYHLLSTRAYWKGYLKSNGNVICDANGNVRYRMYPVKHLTYDMLTNIETNAYLKPSYKRPYYMLEDNPKNLGTEDNTDTTRYYQNRPIIHVHTGKAETDIDLEQVLINYLKLPEEVILTNEQVYVNTTDTSQILEYPDSVKNDLIKKLTGYFLENVSNPRVQTFEAFNPDHRLPQRAIAEG